MPKAKWLESKFNGNDKYHAFPLLELLHITKLKALEDWFEAGVAAEDGCLFHCLIQLRVYGCPNITSLPLADEIARLAALRYLIMIICPNLISLGRYREVETTNNCHLMLSDLFISDPSVLLMEPLRSIASLKKLSIWSNDELFTFTNESEQWFMKVRSSLSEMNFLFLKSLQSLPSSLESLSSLKDLYIEDVPMFSKI
ncbi:hypothetical protein MA16_Dca027590 [Dendrobium catenatum]|uniref:Uncharacterized protein n=1 Tax=Dendrobium catenatum TaxID=906689 RepID=A0A2I0XIZ8_9ASPA|nr:hypothetical protein MA16_Dca027590 [Dendrobium catenatum]